MVDWVCVDIGLLPGGNFSLARAATRDDGFFIIVGGADVGTFDSHAFRWSLAAGMEDLGLLPGGTFSFAYSVSLDGEVVCGYADTSAGLIVPFRWTEIDGMVALPLLAGDDRGTAYCIAPDGSVIVGFSQLLSTDTVRPCYWPDSGGVVELPQGPGNTYSIAAACGDSATVIFGGTNVTTDTPWSWTSGGGPVSVPLASGQTVGQVNACDIAGDAATGFSATTPGGTSEAFLWKAIGGTSLIGALPSADFSIAYGMSGLGTKIVGSSAPFGDNQAFYWTEADGFEILPPLAGGDDTVAFGICAFRDNPVGMCLIGGFQHAVYWTEGTTPTFNGSQVADLFFTNTASFVDLDDASNRRKFVTVTGGDEYLGPVGQIPFGVAPPAFLTRAGDPDTFATNNGNGGSFTITGTLEESLTDPPGSASSTAIPVIPTAGRGVLGDYRNGNLYNFNPLTLTDNGTPRKWLRRWRALPKGTVETVTFHWLTIDMQTGIEVPPASDPQLVLRWSDDGGKTWSNERVVSAGKSGATTQTIKFNRLGATRRFSGSDRIFELSSSDPFAVSILDADTEVS